ncbi:hypothetical protein PR202_ga01735 [Eleusine coracana subsp. coracana]|uniref:Vesicle transport protein n=1 Tax=Eleusine coracana subsp. coracana TaxID=191504 RepID=A0AAV5BI32_ELECO|nr:hypothetical protein PR202_ga01048 [Eleusine coracana subsp. coracana]GJM85926.1 hypothetical protein PR202_ga01735 [Eleusine coracana subsp. coracana]
MDTMRGALERAKMLVGMEVDEESGLPPPEEQSFFDDFNRNCTLNTTQASVHPLPPSPFRPPRIRSVQPCPYPDLAWDLTRQCTTLGPRLYGFAICLAAGLTCTILSMFVFFHPVKFGVTFTLGNLMALGRSVSLLYSISYRPKRQLDMMLDSVRIYATALYIASIIIALFCALYVHSKLLTLLAIILEFGALVWYSLSYIPFARSVVSRVMTSCFDTEF